MAMIAVWLKIDEERLVQALQEAGEKLDSAEGEIVLDFSSVQRVDTAAVQALEKLARLADEKKIKVVVRGANVGVYKVFKLAKLSGRFSFLN